MKAQQMGMALLGIIFGITGCARINTQVVDKPRVDQDLQGNRGYLAGSVPAGSVERKTTRQVIETDIELPTSKELVPWKIHKGGQESAVQAPVARTEAPSKLADEEKMEAPNEPEEKEIEHAAPVARHHDKTVAATVYTVRQGDTLEKIAHKVYGDGTQWRRIYKANKDKLKSPNRVYAGQRLVVPAFESTRRRMSEEASSSDLK